MESEGLLLSWRDAAVAMRRPVLLAMAAIQASVVAFWTAELHVETGVDGILYHHMAEAIVTYGRAPWVVSPLSYVGVYPGSDSSGVPFLVASVSSLSGLPINAAVLVYNLSLLILLGLGLFVLIESILHRQDAALLGMLLGSLSYGFFSSMLWTLDERSFNVAVAPIFVFLIVCIARGSRFGARRVSFGLLAVVSLVMYASHLSVLLLLPLAVVIPLVRHVMLHLHSLRRKARGSAGFYLAAVSFPVLVIVSLSWSGILTGLGLQMSLEHSALISGSSAEAYLINTGVFLSTRAGPAIIALAALGLLYFGTRPLLSEDRVIVGGLLLGGLVGLPIIVYSKDVVTPILVVPASIAIPVVVQRLRGRKAVVLSVAAVIVVSGSLVFDQWNMGRTTAQSNRLYWTSPGLTNEPASANAWIGARSGSPVCLYGNNWLATRYTSTSPYELLCGDSPVESLGWMQVGPGGPRSIQVRFVGLGDPSPNNWFKSPELDQIATDFASIPSLDYASGIAMLSRYHVTYVVIALQNPMDVPLYQYQGIRESRFFSELWLFNYPLYRTEGFAIFAV